MPTFRTARLLVPAGIFLVSSAVAWGQAASFRGNAAHSGVYASPTAPMLERIQWKFKTGGKVISSPAVVNGIVYIGSSDRSVYALDATPRTESMPDPFDVFLSSPAVAAGTVYFGSGDHRVYALDASSGALRWSFETGNVVHASPAVADGVVYIGSWDRNLYALNAATGALVWKFQTGDDTDTYNQVGIASSAAVAAGTVFFGCRDGHFYAVDARTGARKWDHDNKKGWVIASPTVDRGVVYFPTSDGQRFKALDAATGATIYDISNKTVSFSSPALVRDTVFFGSSDGWVHAIDAATGRMKAEFQTDGSKENSAKYIDAEGHMNYAALYPDSTLDGVIIGLDRMYSLGSVLSSPVVVDSVVYVGSTDGAVYAIR